MELVHVRLAAEDLVGDGRVVVPHARTGLDDVLEVGDDLVVTDQDGEFHGATVIAVGGDGHDPHYNLRIGARLPIDPDLGSAGLQSAGRNLTSACS